MQNFWKLFLRNKTKPKYCNNPSPQNSQKACYEVGAAEKYNKNLSEYERAYIKLKKRADGKYCREISENRKQRVNAEIEEWERLYNYNKKCIEDGELSEEKAIRQLEEQYESIINKN